MREKLDELLRCDPIRLAEKRSGSKVANDVNTANIALMQQMLNNASKELILTEMGDTTMSMTFDEYVNAAIDFGFDILKEDYFQRYNPPVLGIKEKITDEEYLVLWQNGFLLVVESIHDDFIKSIVPGLSILAFTKTGELNFNDPMISFSNTLGAYKRGRNGMFR